MVGKISSATGLHTFPPASETETEAGASSGMQWLLWTVCLAGLPILAYCLFHALRAVPSEPAWLLLAAATIAASSFPVALPTLGKKSSSGHVTASDIFVFAAILMFSAQVAVVVSALEVLVAGLRRAALTKVLFNISKASLVTFAVSHVFYSLHRYPPLDSSQVDNLSLFYLKLMFCVALYILATSAAVARTLSLASKNSFLEVWKEHFLLYSLISIAGISGGAVVFLSFERAQFLAICLAIPLVLILLYAYRMNYGRSESLQKALLMAHHDPLTGLPNRMLFMDRLAVHLAQAERQHLSLALLFLDLDHFKKVNDTLGHDAGDQLLQTVAARLQGCLRASDTVARLAGDEFTIILPGLKGNQPQQADQVAEKILRSLEKPISLGGQQADVTPSIGISLYPSDGRHPERLLKNADTAMYEAKRAGRNRYRFFSQRLSQKGQESKGRRVEKSKSLKKL